ncbi:bifunctional hydroxymethylpyrimidine kinase/phosphomethylpyrimidine kinase [Halorussus amylolyticus]|uniref:bifunctional hydroxymethylpyrimidine kinase/phosphomethylpyrimidine kinase n=1 Tax=Halorussus amylolyticus TaxID=1126242 RepID=UPI00104E2534|nr:bifunctional hydroxymethylpyrimidine kinase/phosphomethylpyrimidine kinase [Halorussus amylolyticus]
MSGVPVALTVAGSDSGGGAGVQADLATMTARGVHATSALTAVTAQNTTGVRASEVLAPDLVTDQIDAVFADFEVGAVKTGMLGDDRVVAVVADALAGADVPVVADPVVVAESGDRLLSPRGVERVREALLPAASLVTPNVPEAEFLADLTIDGPDDAREAGRRLCELGADAALVTGGHFEGDPADVLVADSGDRTTSTRTFRADRVPDAATHGSGCTLSAAIAAELARGTELPAAVERAERHIDRAIRCGREVGSGVGPVEHLAPTKAAAGSAAACDAVREVVREFERRNVSRLLPEVGTNVAVAPDCAVEPSDVVAVEGRIHRVSAGSSGDVTRATGGVAPGASDHVARFLLGIRETDRGISAACNVRADEEVVAEVRDRWETVTVDRANEPEDADGTMDWVAREAMAGRESAPDAVVDGGAVGKESMIRVVAADAERLAEKITRLAAELE